LLSEGARTLEHRHGNSDCYGPTGDTRHYFNPNDTKALSKAEKRFKALTGFTAAVRDAAGNATVGRSFDPTAEETLFFPRLIGG